MVTRRLEDRYLRHTDRFDLVLIEKQMVDARARLENRFRDTGNILDPKTREWYNENAAPSLPTEAYKGNRD